MRTYTDSESKLDAIHLPQLETFCLSPKGSATCNIPGKYWEINPAIGEGCYWYFPIDDIMAVIIVNLEFHVNVVISFDVPDFFCFGKYSGSIVPFFYEKNLCWQKGLFNEKLLGYVWQKGTFTGTIKRGTPLHAVSITLLPAAVKRLGSRFACDPYSLASAISELDGNQAVPGLDELFEALFNVRPGTLSARAFYESKIVEAAALLIDWWHQKQNPAATCIQPVDRTALNATIDYIRNNPGSPITLAELCRVSCMSASKLTGLFKAIEGRTPMKFVRMIRLEHACKLLACSDMPLKEIASVSGFKHQGSFSEAFKARYKMNPLAYRKTHTRHHFDSQEPACPDA